MARCEELRQGVDAARRVMPAGGSAAVEAEDESDGEVGDEEMFGGPEPRLGDGRGGGGDGGGGGGDGGGGGGEEEEDEFDEDQPRRVHVAAAPAPAGRLDDRIAELRTRLVQARPPRARTRSQAPRCCNGERAGGRRLSASASLSVHTFSSRCARVRVCVCVGGGGCGTPPHVGVRLRR